MDSTLTFLRRRRKTSYLCFGIETWEFEPRRYETVVRKPSHPSIFEDCQRHKDRLRELIEISGSLGRTACSWLWFAPHPPRSSLVNLLRVGRDPIRDPFQ